MKGRNGTIYFIGAGPYIKIGWTAGKVRARLVGIQSGCPFELELLGVRPGSLEVEKEFHVRFAAHHLRGEWFHRHEDICTFIKSKCLGRRTEAPTNVPSHDISHSISI